MLRTCMGTESLVTVFKKINKDVTIDNAHTLCAIACNAPEIFMTPAYEHHLQMVAKNYPSNLNKLMALDIAYVYAYTRNLKSHDVYYRLAKCVLRMYDDAVFKDAASIKAVFDAIDTKIIEIKDVLSKDGFPDLNASEYN